MLKRCSTEIPGDTILQEQMLSKHSKTTKKHSAGESPYSPDSDVRGFSDPSTLDPSTHAVILKLSLSLSLAVTLTQWGGH